MTGRANARRAALYGLMCAQALVLSALESMLPPFVPVPGIRIGLSNIVTMFCVCSVSAPCAITVTLFKAFFALLTRGAAAAALSLSGGLLSLAVMLVCFRCSRVRTGLIGTGVLSALAHNAGQLAAACVITGRAVLSLAAPLMLMSVATGILTGAVLKVTLPVLRRQCSAVTGNPINKER